MRILTSQRVSVGLVEIMDHWTIIDLMDTVEALDFRRELEAVAHESAMKKVK